MTTLAFAKVSLCFAAVFAAGGVTGVAITLKRANDPAIRAQVEARWIEKRRLEDARRLALTPAQIEELKPLYTELLADVRGVRERAAADLLEAARRQGRGMWDHLTPEQRQKFLQIAEERRINWQAKSSP